MIFLPKYKALRPKYKGPPEVLEVSPQISGGALFGRELKWEGEKQLELELNRG